MSPESADNEPQDVDPTEFTAVLAEIQEAARVVNARPDMAALVLLIAEMRKLRWSVNEFQYQATGGQP